MKEELQKFGAELVCKQNSVTVLKRELHKPNAVLNSHNDHRIAMSLSVLLSAFGGEIDGAETVNKSYPEFFNDIKKLGIEVV
jgi:3-phosphoshikimate 1-carboxyvinyltransferase